MYVQIQPKILQKKSEPGPDFKNFDSALNYFFKIQIGPKYCTKKSPEPARNKWQQINKPGPALSFFFRNPARKILQKTPKPSPDNIVKN